MLVLAMEFSRGARPSPPGRIDGTGRDGARGRVHKRRSTGIAEEAASAAPSKRNSEVPPPRRDPQRGRPSAPKERTAHSGPSSSA